MQETPKGSRLHIALFGRRNAGKSSLMNALTNQDVALVSEIPGTTTDPVYKAMEILPLGPVMLIDTAGIDDVGELGKIRVERTLEVLKKTDVVLLVVDVTVGLSEYELKTIQECKDLNIPWILVLNKEDLISELEKKQFINEYQEQVQESSICWVSASHCKGISHLKQQLMKENKAGDWLAPSIVGDLLEPGDLVVLVVPIDMAAPKGRLILPQVQTIRDILDHDCLTIVCKEYELKKALSYLQQPPKLVVTDSQVFLKVAADLPPDMPLTSFSILMARYKGDLLSLVQGIHAIESLERGDKILIAEACTHHQQPDDIGKVKIPRWLRQKVGGDLKIDFCNGNTFPNDLANYRLVVHCGGCMLNRKEMLSRINEVKGKGVSIVNYGILIAYIHGILPRTLAPFVEAGILLKA